MSGAEGVLIVRPATEPKDFEEARDLIREYAASLEVDLAYQDFGTELSQLPGDYAAPRGCLLMAWIGARPVACVGVRPLDDTVCEMKRLYVQPEARGRGLGRLLAEATVAFGRLSGYRAMRLDSLPSMTAAQALYRELGFHAIPSYRYSPVEGNVFMELVFADSNDR